MNCHFCGRDCGDSRFALGVPACTACDERLVAFELAKEEAAGVPCARTYIIVHRTGLTAERVADALAVLKARGLAVEDEALDQVWGWRLAEVAP